jgi:hypothetical protein
MSRYASPPVALEALRRGLPRIVPQSPMPNKTGCYWLVTQVATGCHGARCERGHRATLDTPQNGSNMAIAGPEPLPPVRHES